MTLKTEIMMLTIQLCIGINYILKYIAIEQYFTILLFLLYFWLNICILCENKNICCDFWIGGCCIMCTILARHRLPKDTIITWKEENTEQTSVKLQDWKQQSHHWCFPWQLLIKKLGQVCLLVFVSTLHSKPSKYLNSEHRNAVC